MHFPFISNATFLETDFFLPSLGGKYSVGPSHLLHAGFLLGRFSNSKNEVIRSSETSIYIGHYDVISQKIATFRIFVAMTEQTKA
jgi:hypothetical protein